MKPILDFLKTITPPRIVREGLALYGITEVPGSKSNPIIVNWAKETNIKSDDWYNTDSIPWCSVYVAIIAQRAGKDITNIDLSAKSWLKFGTPVNKACLGDVLIFSRKGGGHVGIYICEDSSFYYVLGGNQSDKVNIAKIAKNRCIGIRRPKYNIQPDSVKPYIIKGLDVKPSTNEQ